MDDINKKLGKNENIDPKTAWEEEKKRLSETLHNKMFEYMKQLPQRFFHFQQDYYSGRKGDLELMDITTQPFGQSMQVSKQRLDKQGLTMETELYYIGKDPYSYTESLEDTQNLYGIRSRDVRVHRQFYKNGKRIYNRKSTERSVISILQSKVDGDTAFCPNCGYQDSISSFMDGCDACGSQFTIHDFEPKVAGFSSQENSRTKSDDILRTTTMVFFALIYIIVSIIVLLEAMFQLLDVLFILPNWFENINNTVISILYAGLYSFGFCVTPAAFLLWPILEIIDKHRDSHPMTGQAYVRNLFPNFSIPDFYQNVEYKLRNIHLIDHAKNVSSFVKCDLNHIVPSYKNVVDCDLNRLHFIDKKRTEQGYSIQCEATMRLFCYARKHIHTEYDRIRLSLYGKKNVVDQPVTAMRMYPCPTCSNTLNLFEGTKCKYCGNTYDFTDFDWVIESYEEAERKKDHTSEIIRWYLLIVFIISFWFLLTNPFNL